MEEGLSIEQFFWLLYLYEITAFLFSRYKPDLQTVVKYKTSQVTLKVNALHKVAQKCSYHVLNWLQLSLQELSYSLITLVLKVEKILKGSLDSIPSPSTSEKIQTMGRKVCLRCKSKTLLGIVNKFLNSKSLNFL